MKVIIDTTTIQQRMSGTGYYSLGILRELLKMEGVETVQTLGGDSDIINNLDNNKIEHLFDGETNWHRLLNLKLLANRPNLKADIAIFPNYFMPFGFSIPSIVTIHDLSFISHPQLYSSKMRMFYRNRIKHTFQNASRILTVSDGSRNAVIKASSYQKTNIISIPPGPSLPIRDLNIHSEKPTKYFLLNGNIEKRKNINPTIKAFLETELNDYHLIIAGKRFCKPEYWMEFNQLLTSTSQVHYLGYVDNDKLKSWYSHASGIICCSFIEGFGIPALNARSLNKICLISDDPALRESAGKKAIIVNPYDQKAIAKGFKLLAKSGSSNAEQAKEQYPLAAEIYWKQFSNRLEEVLIESSFNSKPYSFVSKNEKNLSDLKKSILDTISYAAVFAAPIKLQECYRELHFHHCSYEKFRLAIRELCSEYPNLIINKGPLVGLKPYVKTLNAYHSVVTTNNNFIANHALLIGTLLKLPWISGIYFSGGTVHSTHLSETDLDLFIVADSNRVWLVYTLLKFVAQISGTSKILCFNYLIDEQNITIQEQQDLYTAHQILHLKPAVDYLYQPDLKATNQWIYNFFPNAGTTKHSDISENKASSQNCVMEYINLTLMAFWGWIWSRKGVKNRTAGTRWDAHQIKLHTRDHRAYVYQQFSIIRDEVFQTVDENPQNMKQECAV